MNKYQEAELKLDRMKLELTQKDKVITKTRDKITQMTMQLNQATTQVRCCITSSEHPYNPLPVLMCVSFQSF